MPHARRSASAGGRSCSSAFWAGSHQGAQPACFHQGAPGRYGSAMACRLRGRGRHGDPGRAGGREGGRARFVDSTHAQLAATTRGHSAQQGNTLRALLLQAAAAGAPALISRTTHCKCSTELKGGLWKPSSCSRPGCSSCSTRLPVSAISSTTAADSRPSRASRAQVASSNALDALLCAALAVAQQSQELAACGG
jgi:hypothetical protein